MLAPRSIAAAFGVLAFSVSILSGLWSGNLTGVILSRSIWAMAVFVVIGLVIGLVAGVVVRENVDQREAREVASEELPIDDNEVSTDQNSSTETVSEPMGT